MLLPDFLTAVVLQCSQKAKIACKIRDEYTAIKDFKAPRAAARPGALADGSDASANGAAAPSAKDKSTIAKLIESMPAPADECGPVPATSHYFLFVATCRLDLPCVCPCTDAMAEVGSGSPATVH
jgi:hypothetical protein